jgi:hypothetical protein
MKIFHNYVMKISLSYLEKCFHFLINSIISVPPDYFEVDPSKIPNKLEEKLMQNQSAFQQLLADFLQMLLGKIEDYPA